MAVFSTEGIIVKRSNFGEADRILTIITPYKGKITVIAKGVRRITSRRGGNVEVLNKVKLQIFKGSGMSILTEAESIETFPKIKSDLTLLSYGSHLAELSERFLPEEQPNPAAYQLLAAALDLLEKNPRQVFIRAYEVKLLTTLGFWSLNQIQAKEDVKEILKSLEAKSWGEISKIELNQNQALELEKILRYYIEKVLESSLRSSKVMKELKNG
ncbi:MAG: DNA repair protein RecO [Candidatus Daviesbacteria bacterium]